MYGSGQTFAKYLGIMGTGRSDLSQIAMQLFSYNFTDLTSFDSPSKEIWLDEHDVPDFGKRTAREMLEASPDLLHKGLCVGIYDKAGDPISFVPLDLLH